MNRGRLAAVVWVAGIALGLGGSPGRGDEPSSGLPGSASALLDEADAIEILSIDPKDRPSRPEEDFHGWKVLGRTSIRDPEVRKRVVAALRRGISPRRTARPDASSRGMGSARRRGPGRSTS